MQVIAKGKGRAPRIDRTRFDAPAAFAPDGDTPKLTMRQLNEMARPLVHPPIDVAALRKRFGMSQAAFARTFGLSVGAVRDWEQGRCAPDRPAQTLLRVIDRNPKAVEQALAA